MNIHFFKPIRIQEDEKIQTWIGRQADDFFSWKNNYFLWNPLTHSWNEQTLEIRTFKLTIKIFLSFLSLGIVPISALAIKYFYRQHIFNHIRNIRSIQGNVEHVASRVFDFPSISFLSSSTSSSEPITPIQNLDEEVPDIVSIDREKESNNFADCNSFFLDSDLSLLEDAQSSRTSLEDKLTNKDVQLEEFFRLIDENKNKIVKFIKNPFFLKKILNLSPYKLLDKHGFNLDRMIGTKWITECSCNSGGRKERENKFNCKRWLFECQILKNLEDVISPFQTTLTVVSLASAGCFQELVLHARILKKYSQLQTIHWVLIDPVYFSDSSKSKGDPNFETVKEFNQRINLLAPGSRVTCFKNHQAFFEQIEEMQEKPSLFLGIHLGIQLDKESNIPGVSIKQDYKNRIRELKYSFAEGIE